MRGHAGRPSQARRFRSTLWKWMLLSLALQAAILAVVGSGCASRHGAALPSAPSGIVPGMRSIVVRATAYNSTVAQTSGDPTDTAWGHRLTPGMRAIAVSPDLVRIGLGPGTRVRIQGFEEEYIVLDKMASSKRRHIDIYMGRDVQAARRWGSRKLRIWWSEAHATSPSP